jgi:hypothetical protein
VKRESFSECDEVVEMGRSLGLVAFAAVVSLAEEDRTNSLPVWK